MARAEMTAGYNLGPPARVTDVLLDTRAQEDQASSPKWLRILHSIPTVNPLHCSNLAPSFLFESRLRFSHLTFLSL